MQSISKFGNCCPSLIFAVRSIALQLVTNKWVREDSASRCWERPTEETNGHQDRCNSRRDVSRHNVCSIPSVRLSHLERISVRNGSPPAE